MGFIHLASGVIFDATNEEGQLLHTATGTCLALDPLATLFLQTAPNQSPLSRQSRVDWEFFVTGRMVNSPLPRVSLLRKGDAFWKTGALLLNMGSTHLFATLCDLLGWHMRAQQVRQREWEVLAQRLSRLGSPWSDMEVDLLWRLARRELVWCQMLLRSLAPTGVCLVRSIAFCAYLRALGLPAIVVIGRACFDLSGHAPFHAWVELAGFVVNDHAELQSGYRVIQCLPFREKSEQELSSRMNRSHMPR